MISRIALLTFLMVVLSGNSGPLQYTLTCSEKAVAYCGHPTTAGDYTYKWCKKPRTSNGVAYEIKKEWWKPNSPGGPLVYFKVAQWYDCQNTMDRSWIDGSGCLPQCE